MGIKLVFPSPVFLLGDRSPGLRIRAGIGPRGWVNPQLGSFFNLFFIYFIFLFLVWRLLFRVGTGHFGKRQKGSESSSYILHAGLWEDKVDKGISLFLERALDSDGARDWGVEPCSLSPPV